MPLSKTWRRWFGAAIAVAVVALFIGLAPKFHGSLTAALEFVQGLGPWGPAVIVLIYIAVSIALLPSWVLTVGCGFLFGLPGGTAIASCGATLGACASFGLSRRFGREGIFRAAAPKPLLAALDVALARKGFVVVLLTRLSLALPYGPLNYAYGLSSVRFSHYALATWIGMLPGGLLYAYLGSTLKDLSEVAAGVKPPVTLQFVFLAIGLASTLATTIILSRVARRALRESKADALANGQR